MGPDCPPPPPPPPPNDPSSPSHSPCNSQRGQYNPNLGERRREDLSEEINNLRERVMKQSEENNNLHNQVQKLTEENTTLREQVEPAPEEEEDDIELCGAAAAAAPATPIEEECPEDLPEKFDGNPDMLVPFMSQCQLFMEKSTRDFSVDRVRVCFVTSMMTGRAARWASAKLERSHYLMHNYPAFMTEMKHVFEDPQRREAAKRKIRRLRQGMGSVVDYSNAFQMIAQDLDWNEPALIDQYHEGLSDHIQAELARLEVAKTLSALIGQCIHIERRLARAAAARKPRSPPRALVAPQVNNHHHQADPTEPVGGARMRLTQEEKERRRKLNLCLYCGNGGHYADNCPAKASKASPAGKLPGPAVEGPSATGPELIRSPQDDAASSPHLQVMLQIHLPGRHSLFVRAMIDSGASGNFIDHEYVAQNGIPLRIKDWPILVEAIDGRPIASGPVVHETHDLIVDLGDHREVLSFDVTQSPFFPIVLGVRWLSTHDPNITWSTRSIVFDSEYCRYHCRMYSPIPPLLPPPTQPVFYYPVEGYRVYQPVRYYYVQNVYTPVDENVYPDNRLVDPNIEMIPGAHSIPSGHVYSLSESEMAALRDFVARHVKDGLITPTIAPNGAQVLQVKRGWKLQVSYDCRGPNGVTIQNQYPRLTIPNLDDQAHLATYTEFVPQIPGYPTYPAYAAYPTYPVGFAWYPVGRDGHGRSLYVPVVITWNPHWYRQPPVPQYPPPQPPPPPSYSTL
ncbi:retrotransposon-derived protein PEG10 isoform 1 [Capra hircus]|uniref:retrotransposon-derived protein PEG10 isoform 1 n=1 Tax=Capra hircus TaxID=9925 RepID=UPI0004423BED|nr:retrotransposon-derived protein PEG10 isoform 1 [Capra hircus]